MALWMCPKCKTSCRGTAEEVVRALSEHKCPPPSKKQ